MWKLVVGFIVFAAVALYVISKAGDKIDMGGEKHGADAVSAPAGPASVPAAAGSAPAPAAAAASAAK
ncbi:MULTISPECIES: hypothetical protein [Ramlibacter]|uniref:Uncharacterized protein n=1 Tax=Ramlibacter pinisoli TaxID=2682844 RepID=A0A6N8J025_9BURK|nr:MULTISPECIES: hypothetical protein [Ramlibacter]MBA2962697.1 hypothetical protein [Ramlibacter sp. CGMCC 1.13660]MVQ32639.1 hypothetical protein [Ramlibacter pinisoli]